jgi:hypothetical protein
MATKPVLVELLARRFGQAALAPRETGDPSIWRLRW